MRTSHILFLAAGLIVMMATVTYGQEDGASNTTEANNTTTAPGSEPGAEPESSSVAPENDTATDAPTSEPEPQSEPSNTTSAVTMTTAGSDSGSGNSGNATMSTAAPDMSTTSALSTNGTGDTNNTQTTPIQCHVNATMNCTSAVGKCFMSINTTTNATMYGCMPHGDSACPSGTNPFMKVATGCHFCCDTADCNNRVSSPREELLKLCMSGANTISSALSIIALCVMVTGQLIHQVML